MIYNKETLLYIAVFSILVVVLIIIGLTGWGLYALYKLLIG